MNFPELETSRLTLNQLSSNDSEALFKIFSDKEVVKFYDIEAYDAEEQSLKLIEFFNARFIDGLYV